MSWVILGIPIEGSGEGRGEERAPFALRRAGLARALQVDDRGDLEIAIRERERDPRSGITALPEIEHASNLIHQEVTTLLAEGRRPMLVGGCCSLLPGALAAARGDRGKLGLAFIDGHLDFYDGRTSWSGNVAGMDLAIAVGIGARSLTGLAGAPPMVRPESVVAIGVRDDARRRKNGAADPAKVAPGMEILSPADVRALGTDAVGEAAAARLSGLPGFWLHLDLDVLDETVLPAVSFPSPGGFSLEELQDILTPLARLDSLSGVSVADFNPDLDPEGHHARAVVELLAQTLGWAKV